MSATINTDHVEPLVDACVATLRGALNDRIDAVNARHLDFELEHVDVDAYHPGGLSSSVAVLWPFVEVSISDTAYVNASIGQALWDASARCYVAVWCRHPDDETLYRSMLRYGQAALSVLMERDTFGAEVYASQIAVRYRRNPEAQTADALEACAMLVCELGGDDAAG